jgi:peptidoglycan/xylan/chitin deacetylase (PgdA/CDA1 family)
MKRLLLATTLKRSGALAVLRRAYRPRGLLCLNYHRIATQLPRYCDPGVISTSAEQFAAQIRFLKRHAELITPDDIEDARRSRGRFVLVTFDDGYSDNYHAAFEVLRQEGARATFFIATGYIDNPRLSWWDAINALIDSTSAHSLHLPEFELPPLSLSPEQRPDAVRQLLRLYKRLPGERAAALLQRLRELPDAHQPDAIEQWMSWDMLREMQAHGMHIGGHTMHHPVLSRLPIEEQREEILGCAERLHTELGRRPSAFAYPVGNRDSFNADTRQVLKEAGVRYAFSYYGGFQGTATGDDYDIRREPIEPYVAPALFEGIFGLPRVFCGG